MVDLQSKPLIELNLDTREITITNNIKYIDIDKNIANIFLQIYREDNTGLKTYLTKEELDSFVGKMFLIKPGTNDFAEITGINTEEFKSDNGGGVLRFIIPTKCTNRNGIVKCEIHINKDNELLASDIFVYNVKQSLVTQFNNSLLEDSDFPILQQLILEIQKDSNIDDNNRSKVTTYSSYKIENIYAKKEDVGQPTQEQIDAWLNAHPEATTTVQDNSISENKTTFCHVGLNKFNPNELQYGYLNNSNGEFCEELTGIYVSSGFIKVNKDDVLTIYEFGNGYPIAFTRVCEYNNNKEFIVYTDVNNSKYTVKNDGYIRFYSNKNQVTTEGCKVAVTINYNMTNETYEDFGYETSLKVEYAKKSKYATNSKHAEVSDSALNFDGAIETKNLNFVKIGLNKFNPDEVEYGYLDNSNGEVHKEDGQYACSGFVKVSSGDVVSVWGISSGTGYAVYDAAKTFVKFVSQATFENINIDNDGYIRICFYKNSLSQTWSIYNSITINFPTPTTDYYRKFEYLIDEDKLLIDNDAYGKIVSCLGDSITQQGTVANLNGWQLLLKDKLGLARIVNCGIGGSCVSGSTDDAMWQDTRINAIDERSDFIIFMGGTNDWLQNKDIGTIDSVDTNTFYGALNTIVRKLFTRCPNAKIIFAGTIFGKPSNSALTNSYKDYSDAIKAVALKYNIKFIDTSNLMCVNEFNYTNFYQNEEGNYIHPNTLGGKRLCEIMLKGLL